MAQTLRMVFRNQAGRSVAISLDNPRDNLTAAEVEGAMNTIIDKNIITTTGGDLASILYAEIVETTENVLVDNRNQ